jgi:hypothetical protein
MRDLASFRHHQVFLNYPFDSDFALVAEALNFAVVAAGLLPVCALDLTAPDRPRLDILIEAISCCHYSAHDLSRAKGEGKENFARMNMPIEMGLALYPALTSQRGEHRCAFFVASPHDYKRFASDLAGLDPQCHNEDPATAVTLMYEWLRAVVPGTIFNSCPTAEVVAKFNLYREKAASVNGTGTNGQASHVELREVMYIVCEEVSWWDWRKAKFGKTAFPKLPLAWRQAKGEGGRSGHEGGGPHY